MEAIIHFYLGDMAHSLQKTSLQQGEGLLHDALLYATMLGAIGAMVPFLSREDVDFFTHLEMHMRQEVSNLCGRDHLSFRSYYFPVKV